MTFLLVSIGKKPYRDKTQIIQELLKATLNGCTKSDAMHVLGSNGTQGRFYFKFLLEKKLVEDYNVPTGRNQVWPGYIITPKGKEVLSLLNRVYALVES